MHPRRRIPLALGSITAVGVLVAAPAFGGNERRWESRVTLAVSDPFHGRVNSLLHRCEVSRNVVVFQKKAGPDVRFARAVVDDQGRWSSNAPAATGKFYAKVTRYKHQTGPDCLADVSPVREFGT
jgi:hypothetical protein